MEDAELRKRGNSVEDFAEDSQADSDNPPAVITSPRVVVSPAIVLSPNIPLYYLPSSEEDDSEIRLTVAERKKIKMKTEAREIRFFCEDILKGLATYEEDRDKRGKALSERRLENLNRIRAIVLNLKRYKTKQEYIKAVREEISTIRGGTLFINRNKSKLKDALNVIIDLHNLPVSFVSRTLNQEKSHYKKIQKRLNTLPVGKNPKSGLEEVFGEDDDKSADPSSVNNEEKSIGSRLDDAYAEIARLKHKVVALEEENTRLKNRRNVTQSAGASVGDTRQSKSAGSGGRRISPPTEGKSESPTPGSGDAAANRHGSGKKLPTSGGLVFGLSLNADAPSAVPPEKELTARSAGSTEGTKKSRSFGKSSSEGK